MVGEEALWSRGSEKQVDIHVLVLDAEAVSPLPEGHLLVLVGVTLLEEVGGAVLHGNQGDSEWGQLRVGQDPV